MKKQNFINQLKVRFWEFNSEYLLTPGFNRLVNKLLVEKGI